MDCDEQISIIRELISMRLCHVVQLNLMGPLNSGRVFEWISAVLVSSGFQLFWFPVDFSCSGFQWISLHNRELSNFYKPQPLILQTLCNICVWTEKKRLLLWRGGSRGVLIAGCGRSCHPLLSPPLPPSVNTQPRRQSNGKCERLTEEPRWDPHRDLSLVSSRWRRSCWGRSCWRSRGSASRARAMRWTTSRRSGWRRRATARTAPISSYS